MGKISRIQLRGISRTPSDRTTEDGGLAESLNVHIDSGETAPVVKPKDVTEELGIPTNVTFDRLFIHKTSSYENYIFTSVAPEATNGEIYIGFISNGVASRIITLGEGESVNDITSIGNTIVVATNKRTVYAILKSGKYIIIDGATPNVHFSFVNVDEYAVTKDGSQSEIYPWISDTFTIEDSLAITFGEPERNYRVYNEQDINALKLINESYQAIIGHNLELGCFNAPILLRYAITLYDDTMLEASSPVILGAGFNHNETLLERPILIKYKSDVSENNERLRNYTFSIHVYGSFLIGVYKSVGDVNALEMWRDLIKSVDIYVSPTIDIYPERHTSAKQESYSDESDYNFSVILDPINSVDEEKIEKAILSAGTFYKIKSYSVDDLINDSGEIEVLRDDFTGENLWTESNAFDDLKVTSSVLANGLYSYNNSAIAVGGSIILPTGLAHLNGQHAHANSPKDNYAFRYYIESPTSKGLVVYSNNFNNPTLSPFLYPSVGTYIDQTGQVLSKQEIKCDSLGLLTFPDSRCTKVDIFKMSETGGLIYGVHTLEMKPHPFIPMCSYAWIGLGKSFSSLNYTSYDGIASFVDEVEENRIDISANKLMISEPDNPFVFSLAKRYTFQSKVLGVAVASTTLSQGQFGQFPLYVFTEDGIWVMEASSDGTFITSKPLSRDVCNNSYSITPIDQSVVFVASKGVMMLRGSEVVNISPNMNGKHYAVENGAMAIINGQPGFCECGDVLSDTTPFMTFIKNARTAYDYSGKRLIFINPSEAYQYVYKLDTQTWHKTYHPDVANISYAINSYPECLVAAYSEGGISIQVYVSRYDTSYTEEQNASAISSLCPYISIDQARLLIAGETQWITFEANEEFEYYQNILLTQYGISIGRGGSSDAKITKIIDMSTHLDTSLEQQTEKGIIATRPFDMNEPDVLKTITDLRVRGQFAKGAVKFILQGSNDGIHFYTISTLRGKAWKMFRLIILADLAPTERISWVDVMYDSRFTNRLR